MAAVDWLTNEIEAGKTIAEYVISETFFPASLLP